MTYHVAVVGATGMVGRKMLEILEEYDFPVASLTLLASPRSAGQTLVWRGQEYTVEALTAESFDRPLDIAFFSAGGGTSLEFAPIAAEKGVFVIDNSSAWRMNADISLIVPEVNFPDLDLEKSKIIANPNCSTIQSVLPLKPLQDAFGLKRVVYTTYQAVSGSGQKGIADLENGEKGGAPTNYPHPIYGNCIPHIDSFLPDGYTKEEVKMIEETRKILNLPDLPVSATCVRVPVWNGHSVAINVTLDKPATVEEIQALFASAEGIVLQDNPDEDFYPMPINGSGRDEVFVGRIRKDESFPNTFHIWTVADNIRKGAASNTIQIGLKMIQEGLL
ncbi:MAG: aspartate-semialdehyde dehydrogenase [Negativicutes bacterium]|nr:aspartate-semialdehyde dehydrogenase [Negativicutes bacterium]